jgi:hypothetical protein
MQRNFTDELVLQRVLSEHRQDTRMKRGLGLLIFGGFILSTIAVL